MVLLGDTPWKICRWNVVGFEVIISEICGFFFTQSSKEIPQDKFLKSLFEKRHRRKGSEWKAERIIPYREIRSKKYPIFFFYLYPLCLLWRFFGISQFFFLFWFQKILRFFSFFCLFTPKLILGGFFFFKFFSSFILLCGEIQRMTTEGRWREKKGSRSVWDVSGSTRWHHRNALLCIFHLSLPHSTPSQPKKNNNCHSNLRDASLAFGAF